MLEECEQPQCLGRAIGDPNFNWPVRSSKKPKNLRSPRPGPGRRGTLTGSEGGTEYQAVSECHRRAVLAPSTLGGKKPAVARQGKMALSKKRGHWHWQTSVWGHTRATCFNRRAPADSGRSHAGPSRRRPRRGPLNAT